MNSDVFVYILIFVAAFLAAEGLLSLLGGTGRKRRERAAARLRSMASRLQHPDAAENSLLRRAGPRGLLAWLSSHTPGRRELDLLLYRAGSATPAARLVGICVVLGLAAFSAITILAGNALLGLLGAFAGALPIVLLMRQANRRMRRFEEQFPEALELMTRALRAGNSLGFAFQLAGQDLPDPIGPELQLVAEEIKLGQDLEVALSNLSYRVPAGDLPYFVTAILIQRETGGNLAEVLESLGYVVRDRFKLFAKIRSLTSVGRATANILGLWPVLLVGVLVSTGSSFIARLWTTPQGHLMLALAAGVVGLGYWLCRRAATIEV